MASVYMNTSQGMALENIIPTTSETYELLTPNTTDMTTVLQFHPITEFIEMYMIPIVCIVGIAGNTIASLIFLQKSLRNSSCSIFLATRGFSDNGFLSTLLLIWISRTFKLQLGALSGSCRVIIFLSYVCGCISVWTVVFVTIENYIRICKPFVVKRLCRPRSAIAIVMVLCAAATGIYSFPFWAMNPEECIPYSEFYFIVHGLIYADSVITLAVPFLLIVTLMAAIFCDLFKSYKRQGRRSAPTGRRLPNTMAKVTKMLLAVTLSFLVLSLPSHINRLRLMISSIFHDTEGVQYSPLDEAVQQITLLIYYSSLSLNCVVYMVFGTRFRKTFKKLCMCTKFCYFIANESGDKTGAKGYKSVASQACHIQKSTSYEQIRNINNVATLMVCGKYTNTIGIAKHLIGTVNGRSSV